MCARAPTPLGSSLTPPSLAYLPPAYLPRASPPPRPRTPRFPSPSLFVPSPFPRTPFPRRSHSTAECFTLLLHVCVRSYGLYDDTTGARYSLAQPSITIKTVNGQYGHASYHGAHFPDGALRWLRSSRLPEAPACQRMQPRHASRESESPFHAVGGRLGLACSLRDTPWPHHASCLRRRDRRSGSDQRR